MPRASTVEAYNLADLRRLAKRVLPKGLFADPKGGLANMLDSRPMPPWIEEPIHFEPHRPRLSFRTVWISDTHLGTPGCNSELLLDFLKGIECETLYLVGDIIDGWRLKKRPYWPSTHNDVVWRILKRLELSRLPANQRYKVHDRRWKRYEKPLPGHQVQIDVKFITRVFYVRHADVNAIGEKLANLKSPAAPSARPRFQ